MAWHKTTLLHQQVQAHLTVLLLVKEASNHLEINNRL